MAFMSLLSLLNQSSFSVFIDVFMYEITMVYVVGFVIFVLVCACCVLYNSYLCSGYFHGSVVEILWSVLPLLVLSSVIIPSIWFIFILEFLGETDFLIKVVGHQWYWSYYYSDLNFQVDSYMSSAQDTKLGDTNLLLCDVPCVIPFGMNMQFLVTSSDVLHSWALPSLCFKNDAIPGVSSMMGCRTMLPGFYVGMCSELCGAYHAFMPINLEVSSPSNFIFWFNTFN